MSLIVDAQKLGRKLYRLEIRVNGQLIGEYERAQEADIERKKKEIVCAQDKLMELFATHGELKVRWDGQAREKVVRDAQGNRVGEIPKRCWQKPSWE